MTTIEADRPSVTTSLGLPAARRGPRHGRSAVLALAGLEGRRLIRRPLFVVGVLASTAAFAVTVWNRAPALQWDDVKSGAALFPLAVVTFLLSNLAALRSRRHGTDELLDSTPTGPAARTLAHVLSVGWAVAVSTAVLAGFFAYLLTQRPVGSPTL